MHSPPRAISSFWSNDEFRGNTERTPRRDCLPGHAISIRSVPGYPRPAGEIFSNSSNTPSPQSSPRAAPVRCTLSTGRGYPGCKSHGGRGARPRSRDRRHRIQPPDRRRTRGTIRPGTRRRHLSPASLLSECRRRCPRGILRRDWQGYVSASFRLQPRLGESRTCLGRAPRR